MTNWIDRYVGTPFVDGGRDFDGLDCWGLVRLVLKTECNIEVPSYGDISAEDLSAIAKEVAGESSREPWHPTVTPSMFDVAVMHRHVRPIHVGIVVTTMPVRMLHIEKATHVVLVPVNHPSVRHRHIHYFRHRELLNANAA